MIVEDDRSMAEAMKRQIEAWGNQVSIAGDFQNIMKEFLDFDPHLVLIDIMLPFYNGYYWCTEIRKVSGVPVVFISSASDNMNIIMAINMGGDDFITKPFDLNVFNAKIQAILRRTYDLTGKVPVLEQDGALLNLNDMTLIYGEEKIELTKNEFRILRTLMENKGKVVSRNTLMTRLWEDDCYVEENTLTVNMTRIRKKLEQIGLKDFIKTKTGKGYIIGA
jgi:DNA-binding response OmpR family regulator